MNQGDVFNLSFTVSEEVYRGFMELFRDRNPMHCDEEYARRHGFAGRVMYGNILNGFISYFIGECLPVKNVVIMTQNIKYIKPVYLNDTLAFKAEVAGLHESVGMAEIAYAFTNAGGVRVAKGSIQIRILT